MSEIRGERQELVEAYVKASTKAGMAEGEGGGGSSGEAEGEAFPTQGSVMFPFRFQDELRFGACNAMGMLRSEAAAGHWHKIIMIILCLLALYLHMIFKLDFLNFLNQVIGKLHQ